jgi:predicted metal-binding protein
MSLVSRTESESILEVSVRWSHVQIVNFLLLTIKWSKEDIKRAFRLVVFEEDTNAFRRMLKEYSATRFGKIYTFCVFSGSCSCCMPTAAISPGLDS